MDSSDSSDDNGDTNNINDRGLINKLVQRPSYFPDVI